MLLSIYSKVDDEEMEYSDDEKELLAKQAKKKHQKKKPSKYSHETHQHNYKQGSNGNIDNYYNRSHGMSYAGNHFANQSMYATNYFPRQASYHTPNFTYQQTLGPSLPVQGM